VSFATLLRNLRGDETQRAFALRLGVHQSQIYRQETGVGGPTAPVIAGLLREFPDRWGEIAAALMHWAFSDDALGRDETTLPRAG
jgi:hypothetical protein